MGDVTSWGLLLCCIAVVCSANRHPPSLSRKVEDRVIAKVGKNRKLLCPVNADHHLTQWKKNGHTLSPAWERFKVSRDGHLKIRNVQLTDAGRYTCVATNGFGSMNVNYTLVVLDEVRKVFQEADTVLDRTPDVDIYKAPASPVFQELNDMRQWATITRPKNSSFHLSCKAQGNPQPKIQWYKDSKPYKRSFSTLKITKADVKDSGQYTCVASNRVGNVNFTYTVNVFDDSLRSAKLIAPHPLNQTVYVGDSVSFQCFIESVMPPEVKWLRRTADNPKLLRDSNPIKYKDDVLTLLKGAGIMQAKRDGSFLNKLVIQGVQPEHAGMYVCSALTQNGFVSRRAFLNVRPVVDGVNPSADPSLSDSQQSSGSSSENSNLPLLIGLPACGLLIIILIIVFLLQRNNRCKRSSTNSKVPRAPVPPAEREAYYYSNCQQHHMQHSVNPLLMSRDKLPKTPTPSVDMTVTGSEFSSVSRSHHPHHFYSHNNHNFGY